MKYGTCSASALVICLSLAFSLFSTEAPAQGPVLTEKKPQAVKEVKEAAPAVQQGTMRGAMPDLTSPNPSISVWSVDSPEGPFAGNCNCCFKQGYMPMIKAMCYVRNVGKGPSAACKAKLAWKDRSNAPRTKVVDLPALEAGKQTLVNVSFDPGQTFSTAYPVTLTIDHLNQVAESDENNNSVTFDFEQYRQAHLYQFTNCK